MIASIFFIVPDLPVPRVSGPSRWSGRVPSCLRTRAPDAGYPAGRARAVPTAGAPRRATSIGIGVAADPAAAHILGKMLTKGSIGRFSRAPAALRGGCLFASDGLTEGARMAGIAQSVRAP